MHFELISGMQAVGAHHSKRTDSLQPSECVEMCKKDNNCKSINIDYKEGVCEFFDEQNTVNMDTQSQKTKDQEQVSPVNLSMQQQSSQFNLQQKTSQFEQQKSNAPLAQSNGQQLHTTGLQIKNRSLSIFQTDPQPNYPQSNYQQQQPNYQQQSNYQQQQQTYQQQLVNNEQKSKIQLKVNQNVNYFVKTCLTELNSCDTHWSFERQIGKRLELLNSDKNGQYYSEKLIPNVTTRGECQSACLKYSLSNQDRNQPSRYPAFSSQFKKDLVKESNFVCRSLNFNTKTGACKLMSYNQVCISNYGMIFYKLN